MTQRFNNTVTKLYTAFHGGNLDAFDCAHCAIGNMCDNNGNWDMHSMPGIGRLPMRESGVWFKPPKHKDYSSEELADIEYIFLSAWSEAKSDNGYDKEIQFKGLCAVIEYLAELDNIPNPFNFDNLFNQDKETASLELSVIEN